jgi:MFS family permease
MNSEDAAAPVGSQSKQAATALKYALIGLGGTCIEWYDFLLYGTAAALVFPTVFFPATLSPFIALMASFSTLAVGFFARPAGAVLCGHIGDSVGRKTAFALSLVAMGTATTLIGVLPSYRTAGIWSPIALVLLRLIQGLALGGQWGGATVLATESAPKSKRGLYGSIAQAGVPVGVLLANAAFLIANNVMSSASFNDYGWRIPFLFSIVLVGLGLFVHFRLEDTATFRQAPRPQTARGFHSPVLDALRLQFRSIFLAAGAYIWALLSFYILITYVVAYGTSAAGLQLPRSTLLSAVLLGQVMSFVPLFMAGTLSDRYGRRGIFMTGPALMCVWAFVIFPLVETRSLLGITLAIGVGLCIVCVSYGPLAAMFAELFRTQHRYSAVSLAYQISSIVGGGFGPIIATAIYQRYRSNFAISVFIASACVLSLVCASMLKETRGTDFDEHNEPSVA